MSLKATLAGCGEAYPPRLRILLFAFFDFKRVTPLNTAFGLDGF